MIHVLVGEDRAAKDRVIAQLKEQYIRSYEAAQFDYESFSAGKIPADDLKKSLIAVPACGEYRFISIRAAEKLRAPEKKVLIDFSREHQKQTVVVIDIDEGGKNSFIDELGAQAQVTRFASAAKESVFDMTKAIGRADPAEALRILRALFDEGNHPLQIMGAVVWFWSTLRARVGKERFKKGLLVLQEADVNIKRSRVNALYAVEIAVVTLCSLVTC
jgi:DNA polymerase III delta subunit